MIPADMLSAVEAEHPAIAARIAAIWKEPECGAYLGRLLIVDRVERNGFAPHVWSALAGLQELHSLLHPAPADIWGRAA